MGLPVLWRFPSRREWGGPNSHATFPKLQVMPMTGSKRAGIARSKVSPFPPVKDEMNFLPHDSHSSVHPAMAVSLAQELDSHSCSAPNPIQCIEPFWVSVYTSVKWG